MKGGISWAVAESLLRTIRNCSNGSGEPLKLEIILTLLYDHKTWRGDGIQYVKTRRDCMVKFFRETDFSSPSSSCFCRKGNHAFFATFLEKKRKKTGERERERGPVIATSP